MVATVTINPMLTTNAAGLFKTSTQGYTQGDAMADPAVKFALAGGVLSANATAPLWAGTPIQEFIPAASTQPGQYCLGSTLLQATASAVPTAICVINQAFGGITTTSSTAPLFSPGMSVNYYRFGSGARIPLAIDPALISLDGGLINPVVYWDYTANRIVGTQPGSQAAFPVKILNINVTDNLCITYNSGTGAANWTNTGALALCLI
jgi:hypothetical protein